METFAKTSARRVAVLDSTVEEVMHRGVLVCQAPTRRSRTWPS